MVRFGLRKILLLFIFLASFLLALLFLIGRDLKPVVVIVPHFNLFQEKREEICKEVANKRLVTNKIILISPNHFGIDQTKIYSSSRNWELSNGQLLYDSETGSKFGSVANYSEDLLLNDHGIYNILPNIRNFFPKAKIAPFLLGSKVDRDKLNIFSTLLNNNCRDDCLLIASVDFSHYLPYVLADIHDLYTEEVLQRMDSDKILGVEVDSPQSLYVALTFAKSKNAKDWKQYWQGNSGKMIKSRDIETTSTIMGWYSGGKARPSAVNNKTFLVARNLDKVDKPGLGERFFYGTGYSDLKLEGTFNAGLRLNIVPSIETTTSSALINGKLTVFVGEDLTVAGFVGENETKIIFLPLDLTENPPVLLRGKEKTDYFEKLLSNIGDQPESIVDVFGGTVILK